MEINIRPGIETDCDSIMGLIKELAIYEGMLDQVKIDSTDLKRDAFHTSPPALRILVAELTAPKESAGSESDKIIVGYALYYQTYSGWKGKALHLEDLFVQPQYRFKGVGEKLLGKLAQIALEGDFARVSFECIDWNDLAMKFYRKHGAEDVTVKEHWHSYRFSNEAMKKLALEN
ncbi:unnamed protein product [Orchesella dallaii]|uniref:N-acetyltransferase domain-containing protein n=1 Tax=Orchesella dallaii TaxID=48710 RepID=A0ABP1QCX6_9HEXA